LGRKFFRASNRRRRRCHEFSEMPVGNERVAGGAGGRLRLSIGGRNECMPRHREICTNRKKMMLAREAVRALRPDQRDGLRYAGIGPGDSYIGLWRMVNHYRHRLHGIQVQMGKPHRPTAHSKIWVSGPSSFGITLGTILVRRMGIWLRIPVIADSHSNPSRTASRAVGPAPGLSFLVFMASPSAWRRSQVSSSGRAHKR
jgi:hypothetical protein